MVKKISDFSTRLKTYRTEKGLTLAEMEGLTQVPNQTLNRYELKQRIPKYDVAVSIAERLGLNPLWLLGYDVSIHSDPEYDNEDDCIEFKELLRNRRHALNLTLLDVANAVGVSESTVSRWESGDIADLKKSRIASLANVLQISPAAILANDYADINEKNDSISTDVDDAYELGRKIKRLRESRGLRLIDVAESCGVKEATAQRWESGNIKTIKPKHILAIARLFDCDPGYLLEKNENVIPKKNENSLYQYTNGFSGSVSKDRKEIMLRFFQNSPQYSPDGELEGIVQEDLARIVMNDSHAMLLFNYLKSVLEPLL